MPDDKLYGTDLEQGCVRPGEWLIEGYTVRRCWIVEDVEGTVVGDTRSLSDARHLIADLRSRAS